jgi:hypothetical protein
VGQESVAGDTRPGNCVWYGICDRVHVNGAVKIKNCAYNGPAKVLNSSGVGALKEWCSHLLPNGYEEGDNVYTCCDNEQVKFLYFFELTTNRSDKMVL